MNLTKMIKACSCMLIFSSVMLVQAHTALKESTPGDGITIKVAPSHIDLVFNGPVRLIKLDLKAPDHEMPTSFQVQIDPTSNYRVETPNMHPGKFTVEWAAIGADGHTVTNAFSFTVDPNVTGD
ncbi:MAG: hypothetical protein CMQ41_02010 [Gammaproteobacteria bacterium]|nr:hypothetical protein [Gammaproteobacteria bacterium]